CSLPSLTSIDTASTTHAIRILIACVIVSAMTDSPVRAVVFDFDGVLADTERLHLLAFQDAFAPRGWTLDEATYIDRYLGHGDAALIDAYAHDVGARLGAGE